MRTAFIKTLEELAAKDPRITLIVGDLGYGVIEDFQRRFPKQFLNVGVAEQNMTGVAAGMALSGKIVFTYSIANFPLMRCYEQVRNDVCYHKLNVKIVSTGAGFHYGSLSSSHHGTEDLAVARVLPNMTVLAPGDNVEAEWATRAAATVNGPCFLRLGSDSEVHSSSRSDFVLGRALLLHEGKDVTLISIGSMLKVVLDAAEFLRAAGLDSTIIHHHTFKPFDEDILSKTLPNSSLLVTVEEHSIIGGLGSAVAEVMAKESLHGVRLLRIGIPDTFADCIGDKDYLRTRYGLTGDAVAKRVLTLV